MIPAEVLTHPKQGFGIPLGAWFRGPLVDWSRELLLGGRAPLADWFHETPIRAMLDEHLDGKSDHGKRLYSLVMLAGWAQSIGT